MSEILFAEKHFFSIFAVHVFCLKRQQVVVTDEGKEGEGRPQERFYIVGGMSASSGR